MVFALPENSVIKMKFCGRQARRQKLPDLLRQSADRCGAQHATATQGN
jgi:hypothetical protein